MRRTWSTIGTRARLVREHFRAVEPEVGITVQRTGNQCRDADRSSGLRPRIKGEVATQRHQGAVAPSADLQSDAALRRRVSRGQLFLAVVHQSHRPPDRLRQRRDGGLQETEFTAESTTHRHGIDGDLMVGEPERAGDFRARMEQRLG